MFRKSLSALTHVPTAAGGVHRLFAVSAPLAMPQELAHVKAIPSGIQAGFSSPYAAQGALVQRPGGLGAHEKKCGSIWDGGKHGHRCAGSPLVGRNLMVKGASSGNTALAENQPQTVPSVGLTPTGASGCIWSKPAGIQGGGHYQHTLKTDTGLN